MITRRLAGILGWPVLLLTVFAPGGVCWAGEAPLLLKEMGLRTRYDPATRSSSQTRLFLLAIGDTSRQDERALGRARAGLGRFAMNAAQYFPNGDGTWKLLNFRLPERTVEETQRFLGIIADPKVKEFLKSPYDFPGDFGQPGDFVFKCSSIPKSELPHPFRAVSEEALQPIEGIFQYNEDGTMTLLLREPHDEDGSAQKAFEHLKGEIEALPPGPQS